MRQYDLPLKFDHSLKHLQLMLMQIDLLLHRQVRAVQEANRQRADALSSQYISDTEANALLKQPFGTSWRHLVNGNGADREAAYRQALQKAEAQAAALRAEAERPPRLDYLAQAFGLSDFERDVLLVALAPALDLRYERLYGYLLDDATRRRPSVQLILDLLCDPGPARLLMLPYFDDEAALFRYGFLEKVAEPGAVAPPLLDQALVPDQALVNWLLGDYRPHADLEEAAELMAVDDVSDDLLAAASRLETLAAAAVERPILAFDGPDEEGQRGAARLLAYQMERPLLAVDLEALVKQGLTPARAVRLALRDARLAAALPYLHGWDAVLEEGAPETAVLSQICNYPEMLIVAGRSPWRPSGLARRREILTLSFPVPNYNERLQLWRHFLADLDAAKLDLPKLAGQFLLTTGQIRDVAAAARDRAAQNGRLPGDAELFAAARAHSNSRLASLARKITPRYNWDDLILPGDQIDILHEIVSTVLSRPLVIEEWGVGEKLASSAGITVLFAGPPGTGKTMSAEVIANELGLDLYKIDLSSVVSKYIGETEKNLEKIFNEAESSNAVLFFDEADSIFGKRSEVRDAHDRYANIEVSYLLQRMEGYNGITILATNLRANLDEAFMRRIQFAIDFPFPEKEDRLRIWQTLMPTAVPQADDLDLERMAYQFKLAGGNIRNIIVSATYLAADNGHQITMAHLMHGARRELQKMGRLVSEDDLAVE